VTVNPPSEVDLLYPLSLLRARNGEPAPMVEVVDGPSIPEPYRSLLVHRGDMTSRLEGFHGSPMRLRVLHVEFDAGAYRREVILLSRTSRLPVEYGAIEIRLTAFPEALRCDIVEGVLPLGGLLNRAGMHYFSEPRAFLRVTPDEPLCRHLGIDAVPALYGRANTLRDGAGAVLAQILEVLRP
jgi:hypothetical protein